MSSLAAPAVAVVMWAIVGDLSEENLFSPDYMFEPPQILSWMQFGLATMSVVILAATAAIARRAWAQGSINGRHLAAVVPVLAVGAYGGLFGRVMTAGVSGANIGGGFMILFSVVFVPSMAALSVGLSVRARRERDVGSDSARLGR